MYAVRFVNIVWGTESIAHWHMLYVTNATNKNHNYCYYCFPHLQFFTQRQLESGVGEWKRRDL